MLLAAVLLVVAVAELWIVGIGDLAPILSVTLSLACVALALRRVVPMLATAGALAGAMVVPSVLGNEAASTFGWLLIALTAAASCGYHASPPLAGLALVLVLSGGALAIEHGPVVSEILFGWILAGGAWIAGRALANQASLTRLAHEHAAVVEESARLHAEAALAEERLRIARDIHDSIAHSVSVMQLHVGGVRRLLTPGQVEERAALMAAEAAGRDATSDMHRILTVLRSGAGSSTPSPSDLEMPSLRHLERLIRATEGAGIEVAYLETGGPRPLAHGVDQAAYRIVQEALTNVRRHAGAHRVEVTVAFGPASLEIEVSDDGRGRVPAARGEPGHGLMGMRERATAYGGTVEAGPGEAGGWVVRARLPLSGASPAQGVGAVGGAEPGEAPAGRGATAGTTALGAAPKGQVAS